MRTGPVEISGRLVLMAEFLDIRTGAWRFPREVADENVARLLAEGLPHADTCGFRFFTRVEAVADMLGGETVLQGGRREIGPRHLIGQVVSREHVIASLGERMIDIASVERLFRAIGNLPDARIVLLHGDKYGVASPDDAVVDLSGIPASGVLGPPEGWAPTVTVAGSKFVVEVVRDLVAARMRSDEPADGAKVRIAVTDGDQGLLDRIVSACQAAGVRFFPRDESVFIPKDRDLTLDVGRARTLRLAWNGEKLTVSLTRA